MDMCEAIIEDNLFEGNRAVNKGGALRYTNKNFTTVYKHNTENRRILSARHLQDESLYDTNTYRNNMAKYAPDIASVAEYYEYKFIQNGKEYSSTQFDEVIIAPGQDIVLKLILYDKEGRPFVEEQECVVNLVFTSGQKLPGGSVILNPESVCKDGVVTWESLNIRQVPETDLQMTFTFSQLFHFFNDVPEFQKPTAFEVTARACEEGESYGEALTCLPCEAGFRLYEQ